MGLNFLSIILVNKKYLSKNFVFGDWEQTLDYRIPEPLHGISLIQINKVLRRNYAQNLK